MIVTLKHDYFPDSVNWFVFVIETQSFLWGTHLIFKYYLGEVHGSPIWMQGCFTVVMPCGRDTPSSFSRGLLQS
jgi:hypothetical protein